MARKLHTQDEEESEEREVFLRDGRKLVVAGEGSIVEIRSDSGLVEVRIRITEEGPVLQLDSARLQLRATEAVEIESQRVAIRAGEVEIQAEADVKVTAEGQTRIVGHPIHLNPDPPDEN